MSDNASDSPALSEAELEAGHAFQMRHLYAPMQYVEIKADAASMARLYARIAASWQAMGETEPHWSVITAEAFRQETLEAQMAAFLDMGRGNRERVVAALGRHGVDFADIRTVIDFGCGVGRVSAAFAEKGCAVTGVDISAAHLAEARATFDRAGLQAADFVQLAALEEIEALPQVDLVFTLIVLQHNPPPIIAAILRRLLGRVRPGGFIYFQVPTYREGYSYDVQADLDSPEGHMEMHVLPQWAAFDILRQAGFSLLEVIEEASCWDPAFRSQVFLAQKTDAPQVPQKPPASAIVPTPPRKNWLSRLNARRKAARRRNRG